MSLYEQETNLEFRENFANKEEFIVTHISNFRKVKRIEDVIKIFAKVCKKIPSKLLMIGDGPERLNAEQLCRKLDVSDKVRFLGKLRVIENMLTISDVFLLPSETESFGLVALEAMASKTAVISTNSGGLNEVNIQGKTGYLSNVGDIDKMSNDIIKLFSDNILLTRFKLNALHHARSFDINHILPKYEEIYNDFCGKMTL